MTVVLILTGGAAGGTAGCGAGAGSSHGGALSFQSMAGGCAAGGGVWGRAGAGSLRQEALPADSGWLHAEGVSLRVLRAGAAGCSSGAGTGATEAPP